MKDKISSASGPKPKNQEAQQKSIKNIPNNEIKKE